MEPEDDGGVTWQLDEGPEPVKSFDRTERLKRILWFTFAGIIVFSAGFTTRTLWTLHPVAATVSSVKPSNSVEGPNVGSAGVNTAANGSPAAMGNVIVVDVHGDVVNPGVYRLPVTARTDDAVRAAGGFKHQGDAAAVNLASPLSDGQEVIVPDSSAAETGRASGGTLKPAVNGSPTNAGGAANTMVDSKPDGNVVDLNTATQATLETLPGIGPGRAEAIIRYRQTHGPFQNVQEVLQVSGIGETIFQRIQPYLVVTP